MDAPGTTAQRAAVRDLQSALERLDFEGPSAASALVGPLREAFSLDHAVCYRIEPEAARLEFMFEAGKGALRAPVSRQLQAGEFQPLYRPARPEPRQRNRVVVHGWDRLAPAAGDTLRQGGLGAVCQMRALVCDGPGLLAWVGGFRAERPSAREAALFATLVRPLQRRLATERRLGDALLWRAGVAAALEELGAPAYLVDDHGHVKHANALGARRIDRSRGAGEAVRRAVAGEPSPLRVTKLASQGVARGFLVIEPLGHGRAHERATRAHLAWRLTPRQTEVFELLARGEPVKVLADRLGCSTRTVEAHATAIYRKARVSSRAELLAKVWSE